MVKELLKCERTAFVFNLNDARQVFASRYRLTLPTAEELQHEIEAERRRIEEQREE